MVWSCDQEADDPLDDVCVVTGAMPGPPGPGTTWDGGDIYLSACAGMSIPICDDVTGLLIPDPCDLDAVVDVAGGFLFSIDQDSVPGCTLDPAHVFFSPCDGATPPTIYCSAASMAITGFDLDALEVDFLDPVGPGKNFPPVVPSLAGWGLLVLTLLMLAVGAIRMRRPIQGN